MEEAAVCQLRGRRIDDVLMTHLDCDHVSGLHDLPGIRAFASREEVAYAWRMPLRYGGLAAGREYELLDFAPDAEAPFGLSADVFGDGSVMAYLTPTHSAGSVIYRVSEGGEFALLVGDNGYGATSWERGLLPGPLYDADNMRTCLAWIKRQSTDPNCVGVFGAHDSVNRCFG